MTRVLRPIEIKTQLEALIQGHGVGARLPSESELALRFAASRNTVRDALASLERDGRVVRRHGRGTFVAAPAATLEAPLNRVTPIPVVIRAAGFTPAVGRMAWSMQPPGTVEQVPVSETGAASNTLSLLYRAGDRAAVWVEYQFKPWVHELNLNWSRFDPLEGVVSFLDTHPKTVLETSHTRIAAVLADAETAALLEVAPGSALLRFETTGFNLLGVALYHSVSFQDGEFLDVSVLRTRL